MDWEKYIPLLVLSHIYTVNMRLAAISFNFWSIHIHKELVYSSV